MIADTLTNTHCFTSAFDPLPCPDSWCPPSGPLRLSSSITTVQPPTLHSARDYPPLALALAFTPLSRCFTNCWILSLSCSLSYLSCRSAQPRLSETYMLAKIRRAKTSVDMSVYLNFIKQFMPCQQEVSNWIGLFYIAWCLNKTSQSIHALHLLGWHWSRPRLNHFILTNTVCIQYSWVVQLQTR